jgi:AcrR family transcriptional regulator
MMTRDVILEKAVELFNDRGYSAVSMRDIADALEKSVGNITYHFKKKSDLVVAIVARQYSDLEQLQFDIVPDLMGLQTQLISMLDFRLKYRFYFASIFELRSEYPQIAEFQAHAKTLLIGHFDKLFQHFSDRGLLRPFRDNDQCRDLATGIIYLMMSWAQQGVGGKEGGDAELLRVVWAVISLCLSKRGEQEYGRFSKSLERPRIESKH